MFNLHRGKSSSDRNQSFPQKKGKKMTEAEMMEQASKINQLFENLIEIKVLNNKFQDKCIKDCIKFEESSNNYLLDAEEKDCLKNCLGKISPFMKIARETFKENDEELFPGMEFEKSSLSGLQSSFLN